MRNPPAVSQTHFNRRQVNENQVYIYIYSMTVISNHLIIVCCHGIWLGGTSSGFDEEEWLIADFQKGETPTFIEHIKAGLRELEGDEKAVLMFSGYVTEGLFHTLLK